MAVKVIYVCMVFPLLTCFAAEKYTTQYDDIDVDEILKSGRLLKNYIKCLDSTGPCTAEGKELKANLPDALATGCSSCSEKQKAASDKITNYLIDNKPDEWERLEKIYDPTGQYREKYLAKHDHAK